jgi:hypothetical protein
VSVNVGAAAEEGLSGRFDATELRVRDASGAMLVATRPGIPFTTTELARARAMADLVRALPPAVGCDREAWVEFG